MITKRRRAGSMTAALFMATLGSVGLCAAPASAAWGKMSDLTRRGHREPFCPFFSGPSCTHTLLFDLHLEYQRDISPYPGSLNFYRLGGELGYLVRLGSADTQLGVVGDIGGLLNDSSAGWYVVPQLRLRWWPMHSFTGIELSGGGVYTRAYSKSNGPSPTRTGGQAELGVTFYGAFTLVTGGQWLRATDGVSSAAFFIGARTNLLLFPWGILKALR